MCVRVREWRWKEAAASREVAVVVGLWLDEQCQWLPHILYLYRAEEDRVRVRCFKSIYPV